MDYHQDWKIVLKDKTEHKGLYKWCLQEISPDGKQVGEDQIPWTWNLYFDADDMALIETLTIGVDFEAERVSEEKVAKVQEYIVGTMRPANTWRRKRAPRYSMLGTGRQIKSMGLRIHPLKDETEKERCSIWGCLSYTTEMDFRDETVDDALEFYLHISRKRFDEYAEKLKSHSDSSVSVRLHGVSGFYAPWSPEISTNAIKVLTSGDEHKVELPENGDFKPRSLGDVSEFEITFSTKRKAEASLRYIDEDEPGEGGDAEDALSVSATVDRLVSPEPENARPLNITESLEFQKAGLKVALTSERWLKRLTYAAWALVVLLGVLVIKR